MALQLNKRKFRLPSATTSAIVIGAGLVLIKTFPHLTSFFKSTTREQEGKDDQTPIEISEVDEVPNDEGVSRSYETLQNVDQWLDANLKSFLLEVSESNVSRKPY